MQDIWEKALCGIRKFSSHYSWFWSLHFSSYLTLQGSAEGEKDTDTKVLSTTSRRSSREHAKCLLSTPIFTDRILICHKEACKDLSCSPCRMGENKDKKKIFY